MKPLIQLFPLAAIVACAWLPSVYAAKPQTVVPQERTTPAWLPERHAEKVAQAKAGKVDLVMIGDSITHYWEKQLNYTQIFAPYNTLNLGVGGDRTQNVLWRLQNGEIDGISPKLVTMMIGTNNSRRDKPGDIVAGIQAIVTELRTRLPETKIVVFSIFPRKAGLEYDTVQAVNQRLPEIADGKQVVHLDISQNFFTKDGVLRPELYGRDLLHLSSRGYDVWHSALKPILDEAGLTVPGDNKKSQASAPVAKSKPRGSDPFRDPFANPIDDPALPRVLIIGDSISIGYTAGVRKLLSGKANVHRVKGNCQYSAVGVKHIDTWLGTGEWDLIHFNFGLWDWYGWGQDPKATPESYAANLEKIVTKLKATKAKLIFAVTTPPCRGPEKKVNITISDERAKAFNDAALVVMKKHSIEINDLYTPFAGNRAKYQLGADNVHYTANAKALQARQVADTIEAALATLKPSTESDPIIRLWPIERVGGEQNRLKDVYRDRRGRKQLSGVLDPNMTVYPATSDQPTPAVVYCPGGAYMILGMPSEEVVKQWNDLGITLFVLKYTIPDNPDAAFNDVQRAMRLVRHQAKKWNVDPKNIGVFGNSAGGHLSARLTQNYDQKVYEPIDEADRVSCEPNFAVLQCAAYFQGRQMDKEFDAELFPMKHKVAPTFLTYSKDDKFSIGGVEYEKRLNEAGGTIQLTLFETGGHGMRGCDWFTACAKWMRQQNITRK